MAHFSSFICEVNGIFARRMCECASFLDCSTYISMYVLCVLHIHRLYNVNSDLNWIFNSHSLNIFALLLFIGNTH